MTEDSHDPRGIGDDGPLGAQARLPGKGCRPRNQAGASVGKMLQNFDQELGRAKRQSLPWAYCLNSMRRSIFPWAQGRGAPALGHFSYEGLVFVAPNNDDLVSNHLAISQVRT